MARINEQKDFMERRSFDETGNIPENHVYRAFHFNDAYVTPQKKNVSV